jgi:hypothetical protein
LSAGLAWNWSFAQLDDTPVRVHHAEHFLSRLDRLATSEVDLALELYPSAAPYD